MSFTLNVPINPVSFGQISTVLVRELYNRKINPNISPIGNSVDLSTQEYVDQNFSDWIKTNAENFLSKYSRKDTCFKIWHLNGSTECIGDKRILLSFYELDSPTAEEVNIVKNQDLVIFTSKYTIDIFKQYGCNNLKYIPLAFDKYNFSQKNKQYFNDRITFNLTGKLEKRKNHKKIIQAWLKKFGNNPKYSLQCSLYNPFIKQQDQQILINSILEGKSYFNISFLNFMNKNSIYNDYLNSGDIILGMSGGEGWGLPEFHSVAIGKHAVILNAHSYKDWASESNSILVNPNGKIEAYDNLFFHKGQKFNQGNIFTFDDDEFISACEKACDKVTNDRVNHEGLKLQNQFSTEKFADRVLETIN
jgi:glycosyltransferase involved in cell wall biosynthesis